MAGPAIQTRKLTRRFGDLVAIRSVDLDVPWGSIVGIVGPNGCGKTTLIRMLVGRLRPTGGRVSVAGMPPRQVRRRGPRMGYMPQEGGLYPELTVRRNVRFFAATEGVSRRARDTAVEQALDAVGLSARSDDRVRALSGGMRRRTSLACALVHHPKLLFLDEPTVGVDPEVRAGMWRTLGRIRESGRAIMVSTHYLAEAERCDAVLLMRAGRILAYDRPRTLLERTGTSDLESAFMALLEEAR